MSSSVGDGARIDSSEQVTLTDCAVRDNRGAGLKQTRVTERSPSGGSAHLGAYAGVRKSVALGWRDGFVG